MHGGERTNSGQVPTFFHRDKLSQWSANVFYILVTTNSGHAMVHLRRCSKMI